MKEHAEKIKIQNEKQREAYNREVSQLQAAHEQKIAQLQKK